MTVLVYACIRVGLSFCTLRRLQIACKGIRPRITTTHAIARMRIISVVEHQ
jgi:hypothetical protein